MSNLTQVILDVQNENFPFAIKRAFYLFDINEGENRGGHAHINCHQFLIAINGSFKVKTINKKKEKVFLLKSKKEGSPKYVV